MCANPSPWMVNICEKGFQIEFNSTRASFIPYFATNISKKTTRKIFMRKGSLKMVKNPEQRFENCEKRFIHACKFYFFPFSSASKAAKNKNRFFSRTFRMFSPPRNWSEVFTINTVALFHGQMDFFTRSFRMKWIFNDTRSWSTKYWEGWREYLKNLPLININESHFAQSFPVLTLRMDRVRGLHSRVPRQPLDLFFKICHKDASHFSIDRIPILKCHQSRCRGIRA